MVEIKEFWVEQKGKSPSKEEISQAIQIAKEHSCMVGIGWFIPYNGTHHIIIESTDTVDEVYSKIPRGYGV